MAGKKSNFQVKNLKKQDENLKTKDVVNIMPPNQNGGDVYGK
jgi:molybdopterin converting factor small subunit